MTFLKSPTLRTDAAAEGRLLQSIKRLQELSDLRGIDYLHSGAVYPEIGPELAGLDAQRAKVEEVFLLTYVSALNAPSSHHCTRSGP